MTASRPFQADAPLAAVPVVVELSGPLARAVPAQSQTGSYLRRRSQDLLQDWLERMGIPARPHVSLSAGTANQGPRFLDMAVLLEKSRCPYSQELVMQVFKGGAKLDEPPGHPAEVRDWLRQTLAEPGPAPGAGIVRALDFMSNLVVATIAAAPVLLIEPPVVDAFLRGAKHELPGQNPPDRGLVEAVLEGLLRFPISLRGRQAAILGEIARGKARGWPTAAIIERLYGLLRPPGIEIHLPPSLLEALEGSPPDPAKPAIKSGQTAQLPESLAGGLGKLRQDLGGTLGLLFPRVYCRADDSLPEQAFQIRINDYSTPTQPAPGSGTVPDSILSFLKRRLLACPDRLVSVEDVEYLLAIYHDEAPALVEAVCVCRGSCELTLVLRQLWRQGVGIRDLRGILEAMLGFNYAVLGPAPPRSGQGGHPPALVDPSPFQLLAEPPPRWLADGRLLAEFVKCRLHEQITTRYAELKDGRQTLRCHRLAAAIEDGLAESLARGAALSPDGRPEWRELFSALAAETERLPEGGTARPILVEPTPDAALLFQELVWPDFPGVPVLHRRLVSPFASIEVVKTLGAGPL